MNFSTFLSTLSESERDFIANLDYGVESGIHRRELDRIIERAGVVDLSEQLWYPYEPVKLGVWVWESGHEREFVACVGIILTNIVSGEDTMNEWETDMRTLRESWSGLHPEHRAMLTPLVDAANRRVVRVGGCDGEWPRSYF